MGRVVAWLSRWVETAIGEVEVSLPQYRVLMLLEKEPEGASVVADELAVTKPTVTAIIDGLVAKGLVDRSPDFADRRRVRLRLTAAGRAALAKADAAADTRMSTILDGLEPPARKAAIKGIETWRKALKP